MLNCDNGFGNDSRTVVSIYKSKMCSDEDRKFIKHYDV